MDDVTTKVIAEALRRWYRLDKVVPIERGISYRLEREEKEAARHLPTFHRPTSPTGPRSA